MKNPGHKIHHAYRTLRGLPERERAGYLAVALVSFCLLLIVLIDHDVRRMARINALSVRSMVVSQAAGSEVAHPGADTTVPSSAPLVRYAALDTAPVAAVAISDATSTDPAHMAALIQKLMLENIELRAKVEELDAVGIRRHDVPDAEVRQVLHGKERVDAPYYYSYWVVHPDSPYKDLPSLKGKSACFPSPISTSGFVAPMGRMVFGCDICQDVCPWNRKAPSSPLAVFQPRKTEQTPTVAAGFSPAESTFAPSLEYLASLSEEEYRAAFRGSPIKRTKWRGLVRNACIALGNAASSTPRIHSLLERLAASPDALISSSARWALSRLGPGVSTSLS